MYSGTNFPDTPTSTPILAKNPELDSVINLVTGIAGEGS